MAEASSQGGGAAVCVYSRIRPFTVEEVRRGDSQEYAWAASPDHLEVEAQSKFHQGQRFRFDHVFDVDASNSTVYETAAKPLILASMEGFNATLFASGVTSAGKTYTMLGNEEVDGIMTLAFQDVFDYIEEHPEREFLLRCSFLELYNEKLRDLLVPENEQPEGGLTIVTAVDDSGSVEIPEATQVILEDPSHALEVIMRGNERRHVASTVMNLTSSRSHAIFRLVIESRALMPGEVASTPNSSRSSSPTSATGPRRQSLRDFSDSVSCSNLYLVDLAGSERMGSFRPEEVEVVKTGTSINKSLLTLSRIISLVAEGKKEKQTHLPFRDSKLTRILQNSLGGNSRLAIICCVTPSLTHADENIQTLRFGQRAKKMKNRVVKNVVEGNQQSLLQRYKLEINRLKDLLFSTRPDLNAKEELELKTAEMQEQLLREEEKRKMLEEKIQRLEKTVLWAGAELHESPRASSTKDAVTGGISPEIPGNTIKRMRTMPSLHLPGKGSSALAELRREHEKHHVQGQAFRPLDSFVEGEDGSRIPSPRISIVDESIFGSSTSISPSSPTPVVGTAHSVTCASTVMEELMGGSSPCNTSASSAASIGEGDGDTDGEEAGSAVVSPAIEGRPNNPINIAAGNRSVEGGDEINNEDDTHEGGSTEDTMTRLQLQKKVSFDARLRNLPHQEEAADGDEDSGMEEVPETEVLSPRLRSTSADDDPAPPESAQKDGSHSLSASTAKLVPGYQRPLKRFSTLEERLEARRSRTSVPPHSTTQSAPQSPRNRGVESQPMHQHHQSAEPPLRRQSSSPSLRAHNRSPSAGSMTGALERRDSMDITSLTVDGSGTPVLGLKVFKGLPEIAASPVSLSTSPRGSLERSQSAGSFGSLPGRSGVRVVDPATPGALSPRSPTTTSVSNNSRQTSTTGGGGNSFNRSASMGAVISRMPERRSEIGELCSPSSPTEPLQQLSVASRKYVQDLEESVSALKVQLQQAAEERVRMNEQTEQQVADLQAEVQLVRQQGILSVQHLQECVQEKEAELKRQREEADQSFQEMLTRLEGEKTEALSQLQQQMETVVDAKSQELQAMSNQVAALEKLLEEEKEARAHAEAKGKSYKKRYKMAKEEVASKHEVEEELREEKELTKNLSDKLHRQIVRNREAKQEFDQTLQCMQEILEYTQEEVALWKEDSASKDSLVKGNIERMAHNEKLLSDWHAFMEALFLAHCYSRQHEDSLRAAQESASNLLAESSSPAGRNLLPRSSDVGSALSRSQLRSPLPDVESPSSLRQSPGRRRKRSVSPGPLTPRAGPPGPGTELVSKLQKITFEWEKLESLSPRSLLHAIVFEDSSPWTFSSPQKSQQHRDHASVASPLLQDLPSEEEEDLEIQQEREGGDSSTSREVELGALQTSLEESGLDPPLRMSISQSSRDLFGTSSTQYDRLHKYDYKSSSPDGIPMSPRRLLLFRREKELGRSAETLQADLLDAHSKLQQYLDRYVDARFRLYEQSRESDKLRQELQLLEKNNASLKSRLERIGKGVRFQKWQESMSSSGLSSFRNTPRHLPSSLNGGTASSEPSSLGVHGQQRVSWSERATCDRGTPEASSSRKSLSPSTATDQASPSASTSIIVPSLADGFHKMGILPVSAQQIKASVEGRKAGTSSPKVAAPTHGKRMTRQEFIQFLREKGTSSDKQDSK